MFDERTMKDRIAAIARQHSKSKSFKDMPLALYAIMEVLADEAERLGIALSVGDAQQMSEEIWKLHKVMKDENDV